MHPGAVTALAMSGRGPEQREAEAISPLVAQPLAEPRRLRPLFRHQLPRTPSRRHELSMQTSR